MAKLLISQALPTEAYVPFTALSSGTRTTSSEKCGLFFVQGSPLIRRQSNLLFLDAEPSSRNVPHLSSRTAKKLWRTPLPARNAAVASYVVDKYEEEDAVDPECTLITEAYPEENKHSWLNEGFLLLKVHSYRILQGEAQHALEHHFEKRQQRAVHGVQSCVKSQSQIFLCGNVSAVANAICPASVEIAEGVFIGTTHM